MSVGQPYICYLERIFGDLISIYRVYSENISTFLKQNVNMQVVKPLKLLRRDILKLIQIYLEKETDFTLFNAHFLPPLQNIVLDYTQSDPQARDPEALMLFATVLKKEGRYIEGFLPTILESLCQPTLEMIMNDFDSFPDFREPFFKLVHNIINHCTQSLLNTLAEKMTTIVQTVIFAMKHRKLEVMEIGLKSMWDLNDRVSSGPAFFAGQFYQHFFVTILRDTFSVMTDLEHLAGFKLQCKIIMQLVGLAQHDALLSQPLLVDGQPHSLPSNRQFVVELLNQDIIAVFPNMNPQQIEAYVLQLFNNVGDWKQFKSAMRDLMISTRSFSSKQNDFYEHEKKVSTAVPTNRSCAEGNREGQEAGKGAQAASTGNAG